MNLIDEIKKNGYVVEQGGHNAGITRLNVLYITPPGGKKTEILPTEQKILFQYANITTTCLEVYKAWYKPETEEEWEQSLINYSLRAKQRIDFERKKLNLIESKYGWDFENFSGDIEVVPGFANSTEIEIGRNEGDTCWCAQFSYQTDIDDFCVERHYFNEKPNDEIVKRVYKLQSIENDLMFNRLLETFCCWECGRQVFWLDIAEDIIECAECAKEKYCGC